MGNTIHNLAVRLFCIFIAISLCLLVSNNAYADIVMGREGVSEPANIDEAIESDPNNADLYNIRGNKYLMEKEYLKAVTHFNRAIETNPNYSEPYNGLGIAFRNMKQFDKAIYNYSKAISLNPNYFEAYNNIGVAYMHLADYKNMCSNFKKACELGSCEKISASRQQGLCQSLATEELAESTNQHESLSFLTNSLFNVILYFLIYISIPVALRYVIIRKPVKSKFNTIAILVPIFIGFSIMINIQKDDAQKMLYQELNMPYKQTSHLIGSPLLYIAMAFSYGILRRDKNRKKAVKR